MKLKFVTVLTFVVISQIFAKQANSHLEDTQPFLKINGQNTSTYSSPLTSSFFDIPEDQAPQNYEINQKLEFEIDTEALQIPHEIVAKSTFDWDFGDGQKGQGTKSTHTYTKAGPYILKINVTYNDIDAPTLLETTLINVLPDASYQLPQVEILVNGKVIKDVTTDIFKIPHNQSIDFQAQVKNSPSTQIVQYTWDFGDSQKASGPHTTHVYKKNPDRTQFFPIVHAVDENGFFADAYVQITAQNGAEENTSSSSTKIKAPILIVGLIIVIVLAFAAFTALSKFKKR